MTAFLTWLLSAWLSPTVIAVLAAVIKSVILLLAVIIAAAFLSFVERRMLALWQDRHGPNRVGWFGLLQLPADMIKMFMKEDWTPPFVDKLTFWLAPVIAMSALLVSFAVVPVTPDWGVADLEIGLLLFLAMAGLGVYSVMLAGWSSNSKYALLGGLRATAQTVTYEVFMGIAAMGVVALAGSFNLREIVEAQRDCWYVIPQFLGFITFTLAGVAVAHRSPFDLPEAEQELASGYHTEYSGLKWGMFFVGEYVGVVVVSAMIVTLFFGGWLPLPYLDQVPLLGTLAAFIPPVVWFAVKVAAFILFFILLRASLPRPRYDQLMDVGWKFALPLTVVNLLVTGAVILAQSGAVWSAQP